MNIDAELVKKLLERTKEMEHKVNELKEKVPTEVLVGQAYIQMKDDVKFLSTVVRLA